MINDIFTYYAAATLLISLLIFIILWAIGTNKKYKFWKKHLTKKKTWFLTLSFFSLLFIWAQIENAFEERTMTILWSIHLLCFAGFTGFSIWKTWQDHSRIASAERRRLLREQKK